MKLRLALALLAIAPGLALAKEKPPEPPPAAPMVVAVPESAATVVVFNENDADSRALAKYYATRRGIAADHVIGVKCTTEEDISRGDYDRDIGAPLRKIFEERGWWKLRADDSPAGRVEQSSIHFLALIRGVPLRIGAVVNYEGDKPAGPPAVAARNEASVDSELAALGVFTRSISGVLNNPYFQSVSPIADATLPPLLLVSRLDAPSAPMVRRMIDDTLSAEQEGLRGFAYIDARGIKEGGLMEGDGWLFHTAIEARKRMPVILDSGEGLFPQAYPMRNAALYFGWYAENVFGPMADPNFRFARGAVAVHIHSFSAATLRDPKRYWCAPLLSAGAVATIGNVAEPYLSLTPALDVFFERLRAGFTLAEAGWMSERTLSWMTTFIGDPLYRPFARKPAPDAEPRDEWEAYAEGARIWFEHEDAGDTKLTDSATKMRSGVLLEGLGLLQLSSNHPVEAIENFAKARTFYTNPEDIVRVTIHEVIQLRALGKQSEALVLTRKVLSTQGSTPGAGVLRLFESEMAPKPAATPPSKKDTKR